MTSAAGQQTQDNRQKILQLLKLRGPMTADELSSELGISSMGVRGHLSALENDKLVEFRTRQRGVGRPGYVYYLTDLGDELFPRTYHQLANNLLDAIRALEGDGGLNKVLEKRTDWLEAQYRARMLDKDLEGRVKELARIRSEEGYMADWSKLDDDTFQLMEHNCAIYQIARQCSQMCGYEIELFRRVLDDANISREAHMMAGGRICTYVIRRKE
jgi:predicted ArsR family transcriptional regulator